MATIKAQATGNWSATGTWSGGVVPGPGDDVYSNTFTVTIDGDRTCSSINNGSGTGITAGGGFVLPAGVTLTANLNAGAGVSLLTASFSSPNVGTVVGNCNGGTGSSHRAAELAGTGTLNVTGNATASTGSGAEPIRVSAAGTLNVTGNLQSSHSGNVTPAINVLNGAGGTVNVTGAVNASPTLASIPIQLGSGAGVCTVNGSVVAGLGEGISATTNTNIVIVVNGAIYASATKNGVRAGGTGCEVRTTGPLYNALGSGLKSMMAVFCESVVFTPTAGLAWRFYEDDHATPVDLYFEGGLPNLPAEADVRAGTVYGSGGARTGALAVPPPEAVGLGVPTDDTTGTAVWTQQAIADAVGPVIVAAMN